MISVEGLVARAGGFALRADLAAPAGALVAVIGPSGAGKSTLLAAIAGFAPVEAGAIRVQGRDLAGLAPADRPVTLLFQENNLFPDLDLAANVALGLRPTLSPTRAERARVEAALAETGLEGLGRRMPAELSGGQRQRAALARALLRDRPVLLLDEPFAALGPGLRAQMLDLVDRTLRARGATVILVTHQPEEARRADLVAFCAERRTGEGPATGGEIRGARPAAEIFADPPAEMAAYLGR
ncbi:thiamine ABC transporter ATP-binding protein [Rubrimonas sp.]|uniref:thiamine ABC transporter ATP-binding protein n=1 Tax=Rubrimonas sp. TaxID=2036015 RepID=UPI002FDD50A4